MRASIEFKNQQNCGRTVSRHHLLCWFVICILASFIFTGCSPKAGPAEVPFEQPQEFTYTGKAAIPEEWWSSFNDTVLNTMIDSALANNLELTAVWEQFQAARALVRQESSFLWPALSAEARTAISRPEPDFAGGENLQAGLAASYELDLWGRIRSGVRAEQFRAQASFYDFQAAAMSISAEISITWYQLLAARKQLELANQQMETNENIIRLIRARFAGGQIRAVDILRQQQLLETTRNQKIIYETEVSLLENQLSVLLGKPPQNDISLSEADLPQLPEPPETGLPLELVRRRPDVQQAYHLVLAADQDMAQAIRNKYPRISLDLTAQMRSNNYNNLFQDWAYTLAGNIVAPLLYGGRLRAEVDFAEATKNQLLYEYGQTVLIAFREVEDALIREIKQKERLEVLQQQLSLAEKTNAQLRNEFLNGITDYLDVLLSLEQEQQLQREIIAAHQSLLESRISLYRALAGGFKTDIEEAS